MNERQALGIDTNEYARTGGINFKLVEKYIREGVYDLRLM